REMLPALAALPSDGVPGGPVPLVISRGHPEVTRRLMRAHGVRCRVLLQEDREVADMYGIVGSPLGYLIDEQMRTMTDLLVGPDALLDLAGGVAELGSHAGVLAQAPGAGVPAGGRAPRLFTR